MCSVLMGVSFMVVSARTTSSGTGTRPGVSGSGKRVSGSGKRLNPYA